MRSADVEGRSEERGVCMEDFELQFNTAWYDFLSETRYQQQTLQGDILEIAIATNRYRFPADVR